MADRPTTTRASRPPRSAAPGGAGAKTGAKKEIAGLPVWMWGVGGLAVVLGYLYFKSHSSSQKGKGQGQGAGRQAFVVGSPTGLSAEQLLLILKDWQGHGGGQHHQGHHHRHKTHHHKHDHDHHHDHDHGHDRSIAGPAGSRIIRGPGGAGRKPKGTG